MLDSGAGIESMAATMKDERSGNGSVRVLGYTWQDDYLRLQMIMAHCGLHAYLANFTGYLPFPEEGLDVVHCT